MENSNRDIRKPDKRLAAVCGLFCPACHVFIATREDPEQLAAMAARYQKSVEELRCNGCRSDQRCFFCTLFCTMAKCAMSRGVEFCGSCPDYPCNDLQTFQSLAPHRIELWKNHARIKEVGYEKWYLEMLEHYSCEACGAINSAYDLKCRKCGAAPSCKYVWLHQEAIEKHLARSKQGV